MHILKNTHFDFLRWRWHALVLSWVIIIAGIITIATKGIPRGVEFAGGTVVIEQFDQAVSVQQVRTALDRNYPNGGQNAVVQKLFESLTLFFPFIAMSFQAVAEDFVEEDARGAAR